jgi:hypothetical protein
MKIALILSSNSHLDYIARIIDKADSSDAPEAGDYGFAQFVKMPFNGEDAIIGVMYNSLLINPDYANFGPRLSPRSENTAFSPDFLNEQGIMIGILPLGSSENGKAFQGIPRRILSPGQEVFAMAKDEIADFHRSSDGSMNIHYFSQIQTHAGLIGASLIEAILGQLDQMAGEKDKSRLNVLKESLIWQRTMGGMRL